MQTVFQNMVTAAIFLLVAGACASSFTDSVPLEERLFKRGFVIGQPVKRIKEYKINGWNSLDRRHVTISIGASRSYLVTLRDNCDGLRSAETIAFNTTVGGLTDWDTLLVRGSGRYLERCYIESIHALRKIRKPTIN
jgi:hypothetical protein